MDGLDGLEWKSPGGLKYRAAYGAKNDRRNSGGTLRQKFNLIDI